MMNSEGHILVEAKTSYCPPCLMKTWQMTEVELYHWLVSFTQDRELSADILQDTFLKALHQEQLFCDIKNQKAWLYRVAKNRAIDKLRHEQYECSLPTEFDVVEARSAQAAVERLVQCLPKAMDKLSPNDRDILEQCDLLKVSQPEYARVHHLSLVATKSKIKRARRKLRLTLERQCRIRFDEHDKVCCFFPEQDKD